MVMIKPGEDVRLTNAANEEESRLDEESMSRVDRISADMDEMDILYDDHALDQYYEELEQYEEQKKRLKSRKYCMYGTFFLVVLAGIITYVVMVTNKKKSYSNEQEIETNNEILSNNETEARLSISEKKIPKAPQNIHQICSPSNIITVEGFATCQKNCLKGKCCASASSTTDQECSKKINNDIICTGYAPCDESIFLRQSLKFEKMSSAHHSATTNGVIRDSSDEIMFIQETCTEEAIGTIKGFAACFRVCEEKMECFEDNPKAKPQWCDNYMPCRRLLISDKKFQDSGDEKKSMVKTLVDKICNHDSFSMPSSVIKCEILCATKICCFHPETIGACPPRKSNNNCGDYSACDFLALPEVSEVEYVEEICKEDKIISDEGFGACQRHCQMRACCFLPGDMNCYYDNMEWCDEFKSCGILVYAKPRLP